MTHEEQLEQNTSTLTPGINAGYRWLWNSGVVVRVGGGAALNLVQKEEVTSERDDQYTRDGRDDLDSKVKTPILANVDLGLGYMF